MTEQCLLSPRLSQWAAYALYFAGLFIDHDPAPSSDREVINQFAGRVVSGRVVSGRFVSGRVGSGRVGSARVGSGRVGSGRAVRIENLLRFERFLTRPGSIREVLTNPYPDP